MRQYLLRTPNRTRRSPNLEAVERELPYLYKGEAWELVVVYPGGRASVLRSGIGPRLGS